MQQWLKGAEIRRRRAALHKRAESIWSRHPREDWSKLDERRSEELLHEDDPSCGVSEWEVNEFLQHTLAVHVPWRHAELQRERRAVFEAALTEVMRQLRKESDAYLYGTMKMTKNELTRRLTKVMGGKLPSSAEVEDAWTDRHQIPAIEWMDDTI